MYDNNDDVILCGIAGTREAAFTYAIAAAGVVHSIARACVGGNLSLCGCSREPRPEDLKKEYQWGGCGDNIIYGAEVAKEFLTAGEEHKSKDSSKMERTLMNLHNNGVGIQVRNDELSRNVFFIPDDMTSIFFLFFCCFFLLNYEAYAMTTASTTATPSKR